MGSDEVAWTGTLSVPLPNILQLVRIIDENLHTELHASFLQVDVKTRNLRVRDARFHRW